MSDTYIFIFYCRNVSTNAEYKRAKDILERYTLHLKINATHMLVV